jgi:hypothetical protein
VKWTKIEHRFVVTQVERHGPDGDMAVRMQGVGDNAQMGYLEVRMPESIARGFSDGDTYILEFSRDHAAR